MSVTTPSWTAAAFYRAVWRWHFYAGLVCAPFLVVLAVTGAIYLFNDEINDLVYPDLRFAAPSGHAATLEEMARSALSDYPGGKVTRIDTPRAEGRSVEIFVTPAAGEPRRVFLDPGTGRVLGSYVYTRTLVGFADVAHGSLMLGTFGDAVVELAACWGFILSITGLYLWWPRGGRRIMSALVPRWSLSGRALWKEWHAAIGTWTAVLIMFLILTGLPWANIWGDLLRRGIDVAGIGYPASHRGHGAAITSTPTVKQATDGAGPWTMDNAVPPQSGAHAHHGGPASGATHGAARPVGVDRVAQVVAAQGMAAPYRLNLPRGASGTYIVFSYPDQPEGQRTLYVDQYSGEVLDDVRFADYGIAAKAVELGVQLHMGNYFGRLNQIVMLVPCLGIIVLALTGPYMWWRRRPKGRLGAPKVLAVPSLRTLAILVLGMGLVFPLAGASLLICLLVDHFARRPWRRLARMG
nr:PepSY domain-containing protein [Xanthobacter tagetidis]